MERNFSQFCEEFLRLTENGTPMVLVTQVSQRGSAPQDIGSRMIVRRHTSGFYRGDGNGSGCEHQDPADCCSRFRSSTERRSGDANFDGEKP